MSHVVNQCEYGCGIVGTHILTTGEMIGEQDMEEHYKNCPNKFALEEKSE